MDLVNDIRPKTLEIFDGKYPQNTICEYLNSRCVLVARVTGLETNVHFHMLYMICLYFDINHSRNCRRYKV
jgi:hypothetical protein